MVSETLVIVAMESLFAAWGSEAGKASSFSVLRICRTTVDAHISGKRFPPLLPLFRPFSLVIGLAPALERILHPIIERNCKLIFYYPFKYSIAFYSVLNKL